MLVVVVNNYQVPMLGLQVYELQLRAGYYLALNLNRGTAYGCNRCVWLLHTKAR
jgi:hypothetical protein